MRTRLAAVLLAAAFCAGLAAAGRPAGLERPLVLREVASSPPLLGLDYGRLDTWLVRVDPTSLKILLGRKLALGRYASAWGFSPGRGALAIGNQASSLNDSPAGIRIIDTVSLRAVQNVELGITGSVAAIHWAQTDRLIAVVRSCCPAGDSVAVVDPLAGRVLERQDLSGSVAAVAEARGTLVLLLEKPSYGPVQLAAVDVSGNLRSVTLDHVEAGVRAGPPPDSLFRAERAGLAVDPGGRAFAMAAGGPVAEVDLANLGVAYHTVTQPVSFLQRLHGWLEPVAQAKGPWVGSARSAVWLGDGRLAIFGRDGSPYSTNNRVEVREWPSGLQVVDTRSWTSWMIDPHSSALVVARNALLSWGLSWDSGEQHETGTGLRIFGPTGQKRFHLFGPRAILDVQVVGPRAFVRKRNVASRYSVVDLRTGRQVRVIRNREMPLLLKGSASYFYG